MKNKKIGRNRNFDINKLIKKLKKGNNISEEELIELIKQTESDALEFKQNIDVREITKTLSAFSNNNGGIVVIGVNDKKTGSERIVGTNIGYQSIENIVTCINDCSEPKLYPIIKSFKVLNKNIILIYINESDNKPVSAFKRFYKRIGNVSKQLDRNEYEKLMLARKNIGFDELINEEATMNDIDIGKVNAYIKRRAEIKGVEEPSIKPSKVLRNIGVTKKINKRLLLNNSALLFFGKEPSKFIPHNEIKLARFKGTSMVEFIDRVELKTTLPGMIEEAEKFVRRNTKKATKIVDFKQQNIAEYPYSAIREAIVNAVAHRDYNFRGTAIRIMIFDDRIEIESPGKLPKGVTLQNLEGSHVLRNQKIANLLYDIGFIEKWGTGIKRMKDAMKEHGLKEPVFEQKDSFFRVVFYGPEDILELAKSESFDLREKGLNERQIEALRLMVNEGKEFTNKRYREMFKVSAASAKRDLTELVRLNMANEVGKGRNLRYISKLSYDPINQKMTQLMTRKNEDKNTDYEEDEEEDTNKIKIRLNDNSIFSIEKDEWISALRMKLDVDELSLDEFKPIFAEKVEKHWNNRTVPTKFPWDASWEEDLKDDIWHELCNKYSSRKGKEIKDRIGDVAYIAGRKNFERDVKEKNLKVIGDGIALCEKPIKGLVITWDSDKGKIYEEISNKYSGIIKKETDKEFEKRKEEAKNKFKNQAELANDVFYQYVSPYLMGIILSKATGGKSGAIITSNGEDRISLVKHNSLVSKKIVQEGDSKKEIIIIKRFNANDNEKKQNTSQKNETDEEDYEEEEEEIIEFGKVKKKSCLCRICCGINIIKKGKRVSKLLGKQIYECKDCGKRFTYDSNIKFKTYPAKAILDAISYYNKGFTINEVCKEVNRRYKIRISKSFVADWIDEFKELCSYPIRTAIRDLNELLIKKAITRIGVKGKHVHYVINSNVPSNVPFNVPFNGTSRNEGKKRK